MFRFTEPSSGQFLKQSIFSDCAHYGIPYCLQVILTLEITLNSIGRCIIWNVYKTPVSISLLKYLKLCYLYIYIYITSNTKTLVRWGCLYMIAANIVSYWSCSKFWRTVSKYILSALCKAKFRVVYHTLILLFWRLLFLLPSYGRLRFRLCLTHYWYITAQRNEPIRIAIKKYVCQRTITTRKQKGGFFLSCGIF